MTPFSDAVTIFIGTLSDELGTPICLAPIPPDGGICAELIGGETSGRDLGGVSARAELSVQLVCKNANQQTAYDTLVRLALCAEGLNDICGDSVQIYGAGVRGAPTLVGNDGGYYIYSMIAFVKIYY